MNRKEKLLIYTADNSLHDALGYIKELSEYDIVDIILYTDLMNLGNCEETVDKQLNQASVVFFDDFENKPINNVFIRNSIFKAINNGKSIICSALFDEININEMKKAAAMKELSFVYTPQPYIIKERDFIQRVEASKIKEISTPVIFVAGISERTEKYYIQLALRHKFKSKGYSVAQIGTKNYCDIFGFHPFPAFMFSSELSELSKIILFNHYVKKIELTEKPDVIIIGIPGGIMPLDTEFNNRFGITAYEISQAVSPDAVIMSVLYENLPQEYFEEINLTAKYRFGFEIDCFNISNTKFDWAESQSERKPCYLSVDKSFVNRKKAELNFQNKPVYSILDSSDTEKLTDFIINRLSEYEMLGIVD